MKTRRPLLIIGGLALLLLSAAVVRQYFYTPKAQSTSVGELAAAQGQIISYSLLDDSRGTHQYTIRLSGYQATFQIPPDFAPYFAKTRFESDLKKGDPVSLSIPAASAGKLITDATIPVFAVRAGAETYLDEHATLDAYNQKNSPKPVPAQTSWAPFIIAGSIMLFIGLACAIWKIARIISARPRKPQTLSDPEALSESSQRLKKILAKGAHEQKSPATAEQKPLTTGAADQEILDTGNSEQKPSEPPQA